MKQPFEKVVEQHGGTVLRVCRVLLGVHDAEDAWSETFLAAMRAYPDLPVDANLEAWLVTIAHRKAIDVTRAAARRAIPVARLPDDAVAPAADSAGDRLDSDLAGAVARLPAKQKQAVAYHYLAGLPYTDVAAIVGGSPPDARLPAKQNQAVHYHCLAGWPYTAVAANVGGSAAAARRAAADGIATLRRSHRRGTERDRQEKACERE